MAATRPKPRLTAAEKYDVLTLLGVAGLSGGPGEQRSMLRLLTLVTARYNWISGEISVGRREIARLWGVDERTVKREMARLKGRGLLILRRAGVRGRVSAYALDFAAIRAACDWSRVGPDFAERMRLAAEPEDARERERAGEGGAVIPFPGAAPAPAATQAPPSPTAEAENAAESAAALSEWSAARRRLRALGPAAHARWIAPLSRAGRAGERLLLEAPSAFHADYVERTYLDAILSALRAVDGSVASVRVSGRASRREGENP